MVGGSNEHPQVLVIVVVSRTLGWVFRRVGQPRVIAEVLGGILLGPTLLGRLPHFTATLFPAASLDRLKLVADFGLVLYLFLIGLEMDLALLGRRARTSISISVSGIVVPFAFGALVSYLLYSQLDIAYPFGGFLLFIGVAMSITVRANEAPTSIPLTLARRLSPSWHASSQKRVLLRRTLASLPCAPRPSTTSPRGVYYPSSSASSPLRRPLTPFTSSCASWRSASSCFFWYGRSWPFW